MTRRRVPARVAAGIIVAMGTKPRHENVQIHAGDRWLDGLLALPPAPAGCVVLVERGSGTLATSRSAFIADALVAAGFATLEIALLAHDEERHAPGTWRHPHSLVPRIAAVLEWIAGQGGLQALPLGMLAREDASAAMIRIAAEGGTALRALASRSGRPDLAGIEPLRMLGTPLLLVVGEQDRETVERNRQAHQVLACPKELAVIAGASHAFEELGTLDEATRTIVAWFNRWLRPPEAA